MLGMALFLCYDDISRNEAQSFKGHMSFQYCGRCKKYNTAVRLKTRWDSLSHS